MESNILPFKSNKVEILNKKLGRILSGTNNRSDSGEVESIYRHYNVLSIPHKGRPHGSNYFDFYLY